MEEGEKRGQSDTVGKELVLVLESLKMEERGHQTRNVGSL